MTKRAGLYTFIMCLLSAAAVAGPTLITYTATDLGSGRWLYDYTVINNTLSESIEEFTIWFGYGTAENISVETMSVSSGTWDEIAYDPFSTPPFDPFDGFYDALALGGSIGIGESVTGFSVSFDWLGDGTPGAQNYEIIDPVTFQAIADGQTQPDMINYIPAPGAFVLTVIGTTLVTLRKRHRVS